MSTILTNKIYKINTIDEYADYDCYTISGQFEMFLDHILNEKNLNINVKKYIHQVCGDILMCNIESFEIFKEKLKNNEPETFEEKTYKVYGILDNLRMYD